MTQSKLCRECGKKHHCQEIYQQMGKAKGPSVTLKAIIAFLLPILIFIISLIIFEKILAKIVDTKQLRTALDFLFALSVTLAIILINKGLSKNK
jgi:hypothetical protein